MKRLKSTVIATALSASLVAPAFASESSSVAATPFNASDMQQMFEQDAGPMQVAALSRTEMKETEGAWVQWAVLGGVGGIMNTIAYVGSNSNWTYSGAAYSFASGAGGALIAGLPGSTAYRAGYAALGGYTMAQPYGGYSWSNW